MPRWQVTRADHPLILPPPLPAPGDPWRWPAELPSPGRLSSPGFPAGYRPLLQLQTRLRAPDGTRLALRVEQLGLEPQRECLYDALTVSWPQGGRVALCGRPEER